MSTSLSAAAADRKARLAQLKNLKRKAPDSSDDPSGAPPTDNDTTLEVSDSTSTYLSGRNYDTATRGPKLGFERSPSAAGTTTTAETRAAALADAAAEQRKAEEEKARDAPLDLFSLQPKKANWDLKRELDRRMEESGLNFKTENAVAKLVRERIEGQRKVAAKEEGANGDGEQVGMEGNVLVEATREREKEDEEDARRERELDAELEAP
ncbi:hypothetical protein K461DRAFT_77200 [Myriangium duriaei CBS 260.36]|uniref:Cwf18 pre-mRNA splicing factor n=1 Tax=Myriangium duriaei CBS 260.36 TaxID=1168546 RepID=A0A9P4J5Q9_9PEZI|nr:hypothetical protein K461DRAFT_77200 [Myriangium duriaei CBS 260.36]